MSNFLWSLDNREEGGAASEPPFSRTPIQLLLYRSSEERYATRRRTRAFTTFLLMRR